MKKLFALLMAAVMLLSACSALADATVEKIEYDDSMSVSVTVPEGYSFYSVVEDGVMSVLLTKDADSMGYVMAIAADAYFDESSRLNDLDADEKALLANALTEDMGETEWTVQTTGYGTEVLVADLDSEDYDMALFVSLYNGYDIMMYASYEDGRVLTEADIAAGMQFITDMQFETVIPEENAEVETVPAE